MKEKERDNTAAVVKNPDLEKSRFSATIEDA